jgi:hypothetical protein
VPVVGSGLEAKARFKHGDIAGGILFAGLAVSDVFLVKALAVGGGKLALKTAGKEGAEKLADDALKQGGDDLVEVFRGTGRTSELSNFDEAGVLLSDAASRGFIESGGPLAEGLARSEVAFQQGVERAGGLDELIRLQGKLGTELEKKLGVERSLISVTTDPAVARRFAGSGGVVFGARVPRSELIKQTLETSTESELFLKSVGFGFQVKF